jgi:hypothetical protein
LPLQLHHKIVKKEKPLVLNTCCHLIAKSLFGCEPMTEHQKIDKNVLDGDIDNKYDNYFRVVFGEFAHVEVIF